MSLLVEGDLHVLVLLARRPGRIDDGQAFDADFRAGQGEFDAGRWDFEGVLGALLHARPHLEAVLPQDLVPVRK
jgi:hypothetical protein